MGLGRGLGLYARIRLNGEPIRCPITGFSGGTPLHRTFQRRGESTKIGGYDFGCSAVFPYYTNIYRKCIERMLIALLTDMISDAMKIILDKLTKQFFLFRKIFFSWCEVPL